MESEKKITTEKEVQVMVEEKLEEIDLGTYPQKSRPISISSKLLKEENVELILLLKEFRDVFVWDYREMPGARPRIGSTYAQRGSWGQVSSPTC